MYCIKCGRQIPNDANHCPECGASQASTVVNGGRQTNPEIKKKPSVAVRFLVIFGAILVGTALSIALLSDANDDTYNYVAPASDNTPSTQDGGTASPTTPTTAPTNNMTMGQKNALASAKSYLSFTAFSYSGLIEQLEYEQYSYEDAVYAVDNCGADWNEQAAKSAETYLEFMSFSRDGLIEQLEYEGFTHEQAVYGVNAVGY